MFESIYKKRKNPIYNIAGWLLLALVCIIFMFVGYSPEVDFMGSSSSVANVNGETISYMDFNRYYDRLQESRNGQKLSEPERKRMQDRAVNDLVDRSLVVQAAKAQNITIPAEEMKDFLMQIPQFQEKGQFSLLRYKELVRAQGLSEARFEEKVSEDMLLQKMNELYQRVAKKDDFLDKQEEVASEIAVNIEFIRKSKAELADLPTEAAIEQALTDKKAKIAEYYQKNLQTEFTDKEQAKAQHILVKTTPTMTETMAFAKIDGIARQLTKENFTEMAKKHSEDPGSKDRGGDLGYFGRGAMVKEFDETAFKAPIGEISKPFKTSFGYHIMLVNDRKQARTKELAEVQKDIAKKLLTDELAEKAVEAANQTLKDNKGDAYIASKGWKWEETGVFSIGDIVIPKLGEDSAIMNAALSLKPGEVAKEIVKKEDSYVFVRLKSLAKGGAKKDQKMDIFKQIMEQQKAMELIQAWLEHLRANSKVTINNKILSQN
ncbi:MAG: SurA N-terminal domain-containing protein [Bdellovibrionaceae bacterium]|nr:SurA N-terminal domain-containing protein [Pseudobdellovibrionaceae bacterium]